MISISREWGIRACFYVVWTPLFGAVWNLMKPGLHWASRYSVRSLLAPLYGVRLFNPDQFRIFGSDVHFCNLFAFKRRIPVIYLLDVS